MHFNYCRIDSWAPLAWLAIGSKGSDKIEVWHGNHVETHSLWFCEAVWPGPFENGDFDMTDLIAGTGGRLRGDAAVFVTPGNTIDRIVSLETSRRLFVSNSLPCLLQVSRAHIDPSYPRYYEDFTTITKGLASYKSYLKTAAGDIRIGMNGYVHWNGQRSASTFKETVRRDFSSFDRYVGFLRESLAQLALNMASPTRRYPYRFLATTSSGYDSPAVSALARLAGCEETICIESDRSGGFENGEQVATSIGLRPIVVARDAWRAPEGREVLFIAADGTAEAVPLAGAEPELGCRVLLTGYHGDKVWAKDTRDLSENIVRGDSSGLSLSEYRLWVGFIHCPITFWGVRQIADLNRLSNSEDMRPWDIPGDYSRPIPRRIAEFAGVPGDSFGLTKRATAVAFPEFLGPSAMKCYLLWLKANRTEWIKRGRLPPIVSARYERLVTKTLGMLESALHRTPFIWRIAPDNSLDRPSDLRRYCFSWAVGKIAQRYQQSVTVLSDP
jgi:hypothetical protein